MTWRMTRAVLGLIDRAVAAGMRPEAAARPVLRLSKLARKPMGDAGRHPRTRCRLRLAEVFVDAGARQPHDLGGARRQEEGFLAAKKVAAVEDPQSNGLSVLCVSCPSTRSFVGALEAIQSMHSCRGTRYDSVC